MPQPINISVENARAYLVERSIIPAHARPVIEPLGWGISNIVLKVSVGDDGFVLKQSLPKLRVQDDWPFDRNRIFIERDCMRLLGALLPKGSVPQVRFSDDENFIFGMSVAPPDGVLWKKVLLEGRVDLETARHVGHLLAQLHSLSALHPEIRSRFAQTTNFIQGRVDPYHVTAARANPDLAPLIQLEIDRMLGVRVALVHGDYSPKNLFAYPDHVLMLDFEVAHMGDPAFDTAFCLNHLILKAIHRPEWRTAYLAAANEFWRAYTQHGEVRSDHDIEGSTVREVGCLLLARIDGKSRIEYITDDETRDFARNLARGILTDPPDRVDALLSDVDHAIARARGG